MTAKELTGEVIPRLAPNQAKRLKSLAISINTEFLNANSLAQQAIEKYITVGQHLLEARSIFPGDKEFGQWAQEQLPEVGKRWRSSLMGVARKFSSLLEKAEDAGQPAAHSTVLLKLPVSTLSELVPASDETLEKVVARLKNGDTVTKREARNMVKGGPSKVSGGPTPSAGPTPGPDDAPSAPPAPTDAPRASDRGDPTSGADAPRDAHPVASQHKVKPNPNSVIELPPPEIRLLSVLTLPMVKRMELTDNPWVILGFNPLTDHPVVSREVLEAVYQAYAPNISGEIHRRFNQAYLEARGELDKAEDDLDLGLVAHRLASGMYD